MLSVNLPSLSAPTNFVFESATAYVARIAALASFAVTLAFVCCGTVFAAQAPEHAPNVHEVTAGAFVRIYNPTLHTMQSWGQARWYINDHTIVRAADGTWHLFGITHQEPADPTHETHFAHATAPSLHGPWSMQPFALTVSPKFGETHLWAPYVLKYHHLWYMFYAAGGPNLAAAEISVATSPDLWHWTRYKGDPLFRDGYAARDPFVVRIGKKWVMYYDATSKPSGGHHVVAYRTSTDLLHWGPRHIAYTDPSKGKGGGNTESPYVVHHDGKYYLFIGPRPGYVGTAVFESTNPFHFSLSHWVGHIAAHALEVVQGPHKHWWVTSAGWGQGGVELAPLRWSTPVSKRTATVCTMFGGELNVPRGMYLVNRGKKHDQMVTVDGATGIAITKTSSSAQAQYLRFNVDDNVAFNGHASALLGTSGYRATIKVHYLDRGAASISLVYDSNDTSTTTMGADTHAETIHVSHSGGWKTATFTVTNARFADREKGGSDFALVIGNSSGELLIAGVEVVLGGFGINPLGKKLCTGH